MRRAAVVLTALLFALMVPAAARGGLVLPPLLGPTAPPVGSAPPGPVSPAPGSILPGVGVDRAGFLADDALVPPLAKAWSVRQLGDTAVVAEGRVFVLTTHGGVIPTTSARASCAGAGPSASTPTR